MKEYVFKTNKEIKSCANCPCKQIYRYKTECNLLLKETVRNGRLEDCPLVGLSEPHGRIIDENDLHIKDTDGLLEASTVWNAPTILEASK